MNKEEIIQKIETAQNILNECLMTLRQVNLSQDKKKESFKSSEYSGPKGGVLLLIQQDFFKDKQSVDCVKDALDKNGYVYHKDVVRNTLNRLSTTKGPLTTIKEGKSKVYVKRK